jgi:hypothetical protein
MKKRGWKMEKGAERARRSRRLGIGMFRFSNVSMQLPLLLAGLVSTSLAEDYSIDWYEIAGGGGASTGGMYSVSGTIGQPDAGSMSGDSFALEGGFWVVPLFLNHAPIMLPIAVDTAQNSSLVLALAKLLHQAYDLDGDPVQIIAVSASTNGGTVWLDSTSVTYIPRANYVGPDRFFLTLSDARGGVSINAVDVTVVATVAAGPLGPPQMNGTNCTVTFAGIPGTMYTLEWAETIEGPWYHLTNCTAPSSPPRIGVFQVTDPIPEGSPSRFYRMAHPPH